jgi:hypothetical protein
MIVLIFVIQLFIIPSISTVSKINETCVFIGSHYSYSGHQEDFFLICRQDNFWACVKFTKYFYSGYYLYRVFI